MGPKWVRPRLPTVFVCICPEWDLPAVEVGPSWVTCETHVGSTSAALRTILLDCVYGFQVGVWSCTVVL